MEPKRLYRSRENRVLCGVCGGIAEYFNVDPVLIRLGMVLFICASVGTFYCVSDHAGSEIGE